MIGSCSAVERSPCTLLSAESLSSNRSLKSSSVTDRCRVCAQMEWTTAIRLRAVLQFRDEYLLLGLQPP